MNIEEAKALLEAEGYRVSEKPAEWKEYACVVSMKMRVPGMTEKIWINVVSSVLREQLYEVIDELRVAIPLFVEANCGKLEVKSFIRTRAGGMRK